MLIVSVLNIKNERGSSARRVLLIHSEPVESLDHLVRDDIFVTVSIRYREHTFPRIRSSTYGCDAGMLHLIRDRVSNVTFLFLKCGDGIHGDDRGNVD